MIYNSPTEKHWNAGIPYQLEHLTSLHVFPSRNVLYSTVLNQVHIPGIHGMVSPTTALQQHRSIMRITIMLEIPVALVLIQYYYYYYYYY